MLFVATACQKVEPTSDFILGQSSVKNMVHGWQLYTNPAFRYEIRFPQGWLTSDSGEDGVIARFQPEQDNEDSLKIIGYTNWKYGYTLSEFYDNQEVNLIASDYDREELELNGNQAIWFKKIPNRMATDPEREVDIVTVYLGDRILELEIRNNFDTVKELINSIKFYGQSTMIVE